jgi:hypothetical protein
MPEEQSTCKVVDLINVDPIKVGDDGGVMISFWHVGKPELPLVFNTKDAQELIVRITKCLASQGDGAAQFLASEFFR